MPKGNPKASELIDPMHWDMIVEGLYGGACVPFLGAAVNVSNIERNYAGLPMGPEVALRLIGTMLGREVKTSDQLARVTKIIPQLKEQGLAEDLARLWLQNLPRVALHVEVKGGDRPFLTRKLRDILLGQHCQPSQLLKVLAELPLRLIVTTNFDRLLERAIEDALVTWLAIRPEDLVDSQALARTLRDAPDPLSLHLYSELSLATRQQLDGYDGTSALQPELQQVLAADLDRLVHGASLYVEQRFAQVLLSDETRALGEANPVGRELLRLNRLLLEEAYPAALRKARKEFKVIVQPLEGFSDKEGREHQINPPKDDVLIIYKLHGTFTDGVSQAGDKGTGLVVTEEDYIQFLTVINDPLTGVPTHVASKLATSTLLFLGYSLEDWDFRTLYKALIEQRLSKYQRRTAFAIQWHPPEFWVKYWRAKGIVIYDCDVYDFAEELKRRYAERYDSLRVSAPLSTLWG